MTREGCMAKSRRTLLEIISSGLPIRQKRKARVVNAKKDYKATRMLCVLMSWFICDDMLSM